jgi:hypothetical protein
MRGRGITQNGITYKSVFPRNWNYFFDTGEAVKTTRAASSGMAVVPLRGKDTFVSNGARTWNASEALREAKTKLAARLAAKNLAARAPL